MWITFLLRSAVRRVRDLIHPYRPELHYMRGPGPKWAAKHSLRRAPVRVRAR